MSTPTTTDRLDTKTGRLIPIAQDANETTDPGPLPPPHSIQPGSPLSFSPSQSPTPAAKVPEQSGQHFYKMIRELVRGASIRRLSWPEGECVLFKAVRLSEESQETDILTLRKADGSEHNWLIARQDLEYAGDWVVVE